MTNGDYSSEYAKLRVQLSQITLDQKKQLLKVYEAAAKEAGDILKSGLPKGVKKFTVDQWNLIEQQLKQSANVIANATDAGIKQSLFDGYELSASIEKQYLNEAFKSAGATLGAKSLTALYSGINTSLITAVSLRVFDGKAYSSAVWGDLYPNGTPIGVFGDWLSRVKNITAAGLSNGRDPITIAKDLEKYVKGGVKTIGRWGTLKPGTKAYIRRLGVGGVDYRALRLVKTELYSGLHDAAQLNGDANPACIGYDWVTQAGRNDWPCECLDLAAGSPYKKGEVPGYPHCDCSCAIREHLMSREEFDAQIKDYINGNNTDGAKSITDWSNKYGVDVQY